MGAGGDLGDDAAVARVLGLGVDDVGEGATPVGFHDRRAGVVAGGLYSEDHGSFIAFRAGYTLGGSSVIYSQGAGVFVKTLPLPSTPATPSNTKRSSEAAA